MNSMCYGLGSSLQLLEHQILKYPSSVPRMTAKHSLSLSQTHTHTHTHTQVIQLTGFSDPVYAEAYVNINQYDIVLDVLIVNQTGDTLQVVY